jgi:hypothetical protein
VTGCCGQTGPPGRTKSHKRARRVEPGCRAKADRENRCRPARIAVDTEPHPAIGLRARHSDFDPRVRAFDRTTTGLQSDAPLQGCSADRLSAGPKSAGLLGVEAKTLAESSVPRFDSHIKGYNGIITAL